jgi:hypothetical protein
MTAQKLLSLFGLKKALEEMPPRELQRMLGPKRNLKKLIKEANDILLPSAANPFSVLKKQLEKFKAVKNK